MTKSEKESQTQTLGSCTDHSIAVMTASIVILLTLFAFMSPASASPVPTGSLSDSLSPEDKQCLNCHAFEQLSKKLASGETLSLHVEGEVFAKSMHHWIGCSGCHRNVDLGTHAQRTSKEKSFASKRARSIALSEVCYECHEDKSHQYKGSIHASLVESGNLAAPVCTDCHGSHSVRAKAEYETLVGAPCKNCHEDIFNAYLESMHGQARGKLGHVNAPICADCHRAHDINVASVEVRLKDACLGCHENAMSAHKKWLPNAGLHLQAVSCPACHAPAARRRIDLMLYDSVAQRPVSEREVAPRLGNLPSANEPGKDGGLDAKELWNLVRDINQDGTKADVTLRGRMEVATGVQAHQLVWKDKAIRDCESCHRDGAEPFQTVSVSLVGDDGTRMSYGAEKGVLNSALSMNSAGGFYVLGGTRIKLLDILLILAVLGGASVPIVHLTMRKFFRKDK